MDCHVEKLRRQLAFKCVSKRSVYFFQRDTYRRTEYGIQRCRSGGLVVRTDLWQLNAIQLTWIFNGSDCGCYLFLD